MAQVRGNLPAELTSFLGRRAELARLRRTLESHRVVTLIGTGGVGKTRLALRVAAEVSRAFGDGVWFVELSDVVDSAVVAPAVASALPAQPGGPEDSALIESVRGMQALLLLDGCDWVVEACAELVGRLLAAAPRLRVLCTSRRPLHICGEAVLPVPPLPVPGEAVDLWVAPLAEFDSVLLFMERARSVRSDFGLGDADAVWVARVCQRLEGLPAAIEFAADRLDVLSVEQLAERLDNPFRLLVTSRRAAPGRHRTLRALVESSYELCSPEEQALWARLAVFSGRFQLDAVAPVCAGGAVDEQSVLDLVAGLVDKSVLTRDELPGGSWYRLPGLLRDYARHRLVEPDEWARLQERHAEWCLRLADEARPGLLTSTTESWLGKIRGNQENLRAAFEFSLVHEQHHARALRLGSGLWYYWVVDGRIAEGRAWLDRGLRACTEPTAERGSALAIAAHLATFDRDLDEAETLLEAARAIEQQVSDQELTGQLLAVGGLYDVLRSGYAAALARLEAGVETLRAAGDVLHAARTLLVLGGVCVFAGDTDRAMRCADEYGQMISGISRGHIFVEWIVAMAKMLMGDAAGALAAQRSCATLARRFDDRAGMVSCVQSGALVFGSSGRHEEAAVLLGAWDVHLWLIFPVMEEHRSRCADAMRVLLGVQRFGELTKQGRELSLREAVDLMAEPPDVVTGADPGADVVLSKREREVAELIADGRSNKEIAAALVISTRTAEGHVGRILDKLGCLSRTQIAAWVTRQRATARKSDEVPASGRQASH